MNGDLISREALKKALKEKFDNFIPEGVYDEIDNVPIVDISKEVWNRSNELLNKRLTYLGRPQGKPVIKCQDCKYRVKEWREDKRMKEKGYWVYGCEHFGEIMGYWFFGGNDDEFCSDAERKGGTE